MTVGFMGVDRWEQEGYRERGARVLLDGVDITMRCRWFNDETGEAECYATYPAEIDPETKAPKIERLHGRVQIVESR